jgi:hypothetical protein
MSTFYDGYTTKSEIIERRTVVGPMAESKAVMAALHDDGWHITRSGPYPMRRFGMFDGTRFLFIAERAVGGTAAGEGEAGK